MPKRKATIEDIAQRAGVSKTTVSRALNAKPDVLPETRDRILRIVEEMRFVPNPAAIGLSKGKAGLLGMLVPSLAWAWVLEVIRGVAERIEQSRYELVLFTTASQERNEEVFSKILTSGLTDGLLAILPPGALATLTEIHAAGFPVVLIDDRGYHPGFPSVAAANRSGALDATRHLIAAGHRAIAFVSGPMEYGCNQQRLDGYRAALEEAGLDFRPAWVREGDFTQAGGEGVAQDLLATPERPTAIFAANDLMAFGAMDAIARAGLRIPDDVAVVGFDDIPQAAVTKPSLTTVRQPMYRMGRAAVEMLIAQIDGQASAETRVELDTELIVRESTGGSGRDTHPPDSPAATGTT